MAESHPIEGHWESATYTDGKGNSVRDGVSHFTFANGTLHRISKSEVDRGQLTAPYILTGTDRAGKIDTEAPGGGPIPWKYKLTMDYELSGDSLLLLRWNSPSEDGPHAKYTRIFRRWRGLPPTGKAPSRRPALEDPILGQLVFNDDLDEYASRLRVGGKSFEFCAHGKTDEDLERALKRGRDIVAAFPKYRSLAADSVLEGFLELVNEWRQSQHRPPIYETKFLSALSLSSVTIGTDEKAHFIFRSEKLFEDHAVLVVIGTDDKCVSAQLAD